MTLKYAICGTGDISAAFMKSAHELDMQVEAVMQRNLEKAKNFALNHQISHYYDSLEEMLESDVDVVYVGLPNSLHYETAKKCLLKGKHVLLEKPVTIYAREFEELVEIAKQHHVYVLEVDRVENLSAYQWIREHVDHDFEMIQIDYCKRSRKYDDYLKGNMPNVFNREFGGGAMYDLGVYALHFLVGIAGKPLEMSYKMKKGRGNVDMSGILTMSYPNFIASITVGKTSHGDSRVLIQADKYRISSNYGPSILSEIRYYQDGKEEIINMKENSFTAFLKKAIHVITTQDELEYEKMTKKSLQVIQLLEEILVTYVDGQ